MSRIEESGGDFAPGEESYYVNKGVYSRLLPEEIPQPEGKIYRGETTGDEFSQG